MLQLLRLTDEIMQATSLRISDETGSEQNHPWRLLVINRALIAMRSQNPEHMEPVFDHLVDTLPDDAALFFEQGMEQIESADCPEPVRQIITRYFQAFGSKRVLH